MFSTKRKIRHTHGDRPAHRQKLEDVVRFTHESMMDNASSVELLSPKKTTEPLISGEEQSWNDIVFQNRNKAYGAYVIRQTYVKNVAMGVTITLILVMVLVLYPTVSKWFVHGEPSPASPPKRIVYTELSAPPPIDKPKPAPPNVQLPKLRKVIKFVPPTVVKEPVAELPPTIVEVKESNIGSEVAEGPAKVLFDEPVEEVVSDAEDNALFVVVDQQPEFPGGYEAMLAFIKQHMQYPPNARRMQIEGTVHISFIVSKSGAISEVTVLRGFMAECDREAVRVVNLMPRWTPGKQNGRNVNVRFILPLKFRLN